MLIQFIFTSNRSQLSRFIQIALIIILWLYFSFFYSRNFINFWKLLKLLLHEFHNIIYIYLIYIYSFIIYSNCPNYYFMTLLFIFSSRNLINFWILLKLLFSINQNDSILSFSLFIFNTFIQIAEITISFIFEI